MKQSWKKEEKQWYAPTQSPQLVTVPPMKFFQIRGQGNPNEPAFSEAVGVLYPLTYAVKNMPKKGPTPPGYFEYDLYPLEGVWSLTEEGRAAATLQKDQMVYNVMIRQPDFVTDEIARMAMDIVRQKKPGPLLGEVVFGTLEDGLCVQMMHHGPFDDEPASFAKMEAFCQANGLRRKSKLHREIYLKDFRKTTPENLRTLLRFAVEHVHGG